MRSLLIGLVELALIAIGVIGLLLVVGAYTW